MSALGVLATIVPPAAPVASAPTDDGTSERTAAFNGVLDKIASATTAQSSASGNQPVAFAADAKKAGPQSPQKNAIPDTPLGGKTADPKAPKDQASKPPTLIDISALAQAALNTALPSSAGLPVVKDAEPPRPTNGTPAAVAPLQAGLSKPSTSPSPLTKSQGEPNPSLKDILAQATTGGSEAQALPQAPAVSARPPSAGTIKANDQSPDTKSQTLASAVAGTKAQTSPDAVSPSAKPSAASEAAAIKTQSTGADPSAQPGPLQAQAAPTASTAKAAGQSSRTTGGRGDGSADQSAGRSAQAGATLAEPQPFALKAAGNAPSPTAKAVTTGVAPADQQGGPKGLKPPTNPGGQSAASTGPSPAASQSLLDTASHGSDRGASGEKSKDRNAPVSGVSSPNPTAAATVSTDAFATATGPAQQIVTALQSLGLSAVSSTRAPSVSPAAPVADIEDQSAQSPTVKTLTLQLNPAHLGPVSITMRLQADSVDIRIAVANPQTLHLLDKDKHLLTAAVEAAGGSRDDLQIAGLSQTSGSSDRGLSGQPQSNPGRQDGFSSNASLTGGQTQNQDRPTPSNLSQSDTDETTPTSPAPLADGQDGSLYL